MPGCPGVRERKSVCFSTSLSLTTISQELVFSYSVTAGKENTRDNEGRRV